MSVNAQGAAGTGIKTESQANATSSTPIPADAVAVNGDWAAVSAPKADAKPAAAGEGKEAPATEQRKADGISDDSVDDGGLLPHKPGELDKADKAGKDAKADGAQGKDGAEGGEAQPLELTIPDGFQANAERMESFKKVAAELKLDKAGAQKLFDLYHAELAEGHAATQKHVEQSIQDIRARFDREGNAAIHADLEVGGANFEASHNYAQKAMRHFFSEPQEYRAFVDFVDKANLRNNPLLFKAWARIGKYISEAEAAPHGSDGGTGNKSSAEILFPNLKGGN